MDMQSIKKPAAKACSVALAVALGSMGVAPVALASSRNGSGSNAAQSAALLAVGDSFEFENGSYGKLKYTVNDDGTSVTCMGLAEDAEAPDDLIVPCAVKDANGTKYTVTKIEKPEDSLFGLYGSDSCSIPATVKELGSGSLEGGYYTYYFFGARPAYDDDSSDFDYLFNDTSSYPSVYALESQLNVKNENGKTWQEIKDVYEETYAGLDVDTFAAPTSFTLDKTSCDLASGSDVTLTANSTFAQGEDFAVDAHKLVTWESNNSSVVAVDDAGKVTAVGDGQAVITAINIYGSTAACTVTVADDRIDIDDWYEVSWDTSMNSLPDQTIGKLSDPTVIAYKGYSSTKLVKDTDFYLSYRAEGSSSVIANISDIVAAGKYYLVVNGKGNYKGSKEFAFNVLPAQAVAGDWTYVAAADGMVVTGYKGTADASADLSIPSRIDGKDVTGIAAGAFSGRVGCLRVPASVKTLASGAFNDLHCDYVLFAGDCPAGPADAVKGSTYIPGIYYAQGSKGWADDAAAAVLAGTNSALDSESSTDWAKALSPAAYDANWYLTYHYNAADNKVSWHAAGYSGPAGVVSVPGKVFTTDYVVALDAGAVADASGVTALNVPASVTQIADGAVCGLSQDAVVNFAGEAPCGASYASEFQLGAGAPAGAKLKMTFMPDFKESWSTGAGSKWASSPAYELGVYDIYTCNPADYLYSLGSDGNYTIMGYTGEATSIRLPSALSGQTVKVYKGFDEASSQPIYEETEATGAVTGVGKLAFGSTKVNPSATVNKVAVPETIKTLGEQAFMQCSLSSIEFEGTPQLQNIGKQCFWMSKLGHISIPASVKSIGEGAFFDSYLTGFSVDAENTSFSEQDGVLFSKDATTLVAYPEACGKKSYVVPDTVKALGAYSFAIPPDGHYGDLGYNGGTLTLNEGLERVDDCAFMNLKWIDTISLPDTVAKLGVNVFGSADELSTVKLPANLETIPDSTFAFCYLLKNVTLPKKLKVIDRMAFQECDSLESFAIPEGTEQIGTAAFDGCGVLHEVSFPSTLKSIGDHAFTVTAIETFDGSNTNIEHIGIGAFSNSNNALKHVMLPATLKTMGNSAFSSCELLEDVKIPANMPLAEIPENTFFGCSSLKRVDIPANVTAVGARSFFGCTGLDTVVFLNRTGIQVGAGAFYRSNTDVNGGADMPLGGITFYGYKKANIADALGTIAQDSKVELLDISMRTPFDVKTPATVGKAVEFNGLCNGAGQLSYQWQLDGKDANNGSSLTYSFTPAAAGTYVVTLKVKSSFDPDNPTSFTTLVVASEASSGGDVTPAPSPSPNPSPAPAPTPVQRIDISEANVSAIAAQVYSGKALKPAVSVSYGGKTLVDGIDYTLQYKDNVLPGKATVVIEGFGDYIGKKLASFDIGKAAQELKVTTKTKKLKAAKLKKKARKAKCIVKVDGANAAVSFARAGGSSRLAVNGKTGKVTVKKGTKKGTYKVKVTVTAAATSCYEAAAKTVTVKVRVL